MGHVDHEIGADRIGDGAHLREVDMARIGRAAGDDHLRLVLVGELGNFLIVDALVVAAHIVRHRLEPLAGQAHRRAVGQVTAGGEVEAEEGVARLHQREEHGGVRLRARMGLDVRKAGAEQLLGAVDGELFGHVDELAAAIIATARIALGVFVGQHRTLGFQHGARDDVLRGDQLDLVALAAELGIDGAGELGIDLGKARREESAGGVAGRSVSFGRHRPASLGGGDASRPTSCRPRNQGGSLSTAPGPFQSTPAARVPCIDAAAGAERRDTAALRTTQGVPVFRHLA